MEEGVGVYSASQLDRNMSYSGNFPERTIANLGSSFVWYTDHLTHSSRSVTVSP